MQVKRMTLLALCICVLIAQEQLLSFIPNVQLSTLLIVVYSKNFKFKELLILLISYVFIDNLLLGGLNPFYMSAMFIAWLTLMISLKTIFKLVNNELKLAFIGGAFGLVYSWIFILAQLFIIDSTSIKEYIVADIPFELILVATNFITILWLYRPVNEFISRYVNKSIE